MPTVPKIVLYATMAFVVPGMLQICTEETCIAKPVMLAGYRLITNPDSYALTFPSMLMIFVTAYIASVAAIGIVNLFKKKSWAQQETPGKV